MIFAIDPGPTQSAYCLIDADLRPVAFAKAANEELLADLWNPSFDIGSHVAIEMVASYGMAVGAEVFETCMWIGRFYEAALPRIYLEPSLVYRKQVALHHCNSPRANDANVAQALRDRFTPGQPNHGKGTKAEPGWFRGFHTDIWQAYALAVYVADTAAA